MGNQMSSQDWRKKKQKRKSQRELTVKDENSESSDEYDEEVLEIEDFFENEENENPGGDNGCKKREKHDDNYILFKSLSLTDLPETIRHLTVFEYIQARGNLVVKVVVSEKSPYREVKDGKEKDTSGHFASGYACISEIETVEVDCPRQNCRKVSGDNNHKVYGGIVVITNRHVINDDFEAECSEYYFHHEEESKSTKHLVTGHGYVLREDDDYKDYVGVKIFFHDAEQVEKMRQYSSEAFEAWHRIPRDLQMEFEKHAVVISHPHGWAKRVSFGKLLEKEVYYNNKNVEKSKSQPEKGINEKVKYKRVSRYTSLTCTGSSGSPVLTGVYWNNPFVHSSSRRVEKFNNQVVGESYFY